jgi:hypothetical protein
VIAPKRLGRLCLVLVLVGLAALLLTSCAADRAKEAVDSDYGEGPERYAPAGDQSAAEFAGTAAQKERHVIRTGSLELTVLDTRGTVNQIKGIVASADGIIGSAYIYELKDGLYAADLTLRVPAARFDPIMDQLQELGKAANIGQSNQDVTMPYVDMAARLKTLKAQEERLREILDMAVKIDEVLQVERELVRVRSEIEAMTAQFTYLQDQVAFSTISLRIKEEAIATQTISPAPFANLGTRVKEAFVRSINAVTTTIAGFIVLVATLLPVLVLVTLIALLIRFVTRRSRRKAPPAQ